VLLLSLSLSLSLSYLSASFFLSLVCFSIIPVVSSLILLVGSSTHRYSPLFMQPRDIERIVLVCLSVSLSLSFRSVYLAVCLSLYTSVSFWACWCVLCHFSRSFGHLLLSPSCSPCDCRMCEAGPYTLELSAERFVLLFRTLSVLFLPFPLPFLCVLCICCPVVRFQSPVPDSDLLCSFLSLDLCCVWLILAVSVVQILKASDIKCTRTGQCGECAEE
jgi:hypothetical protein